MVVSDADARAAIEAVFEIQAEAANDWRTAEVLACSATVSADREARRDDNPFAPVVEKRIPP